MSPAFLFKHPFSGGGIGGIIYQKKSSDYYYYHYNHKGDVVALTDGSAKLAAFYEYDAWGNTMTQAQKSGVDNPYRYSTKEWDEKSGLYYFGARYYSPEIGRWTQRDPRGSVDGLNLYLYVGNGPVSLVDEWGAATRVPGFRNYERCPQCGKYKPKGGKCLNPNCPSNRPKPPPPPQPPAPRPGPQQPPQPEKPCPKREEYKGNLPDICWRFITNPDFSKCQECLEEVLGQAASFGQNAVSIADACNNMMNQVVAFLDRRYKK